MNQKNPPNSPRFVRYVESLGFHDVAVTYTAKDPKQIRAFTFSEFDPQQTRHTMGRSKRHIPGLFVFVLKAGRAVRVDTQKRIVLLGNGKNAVKALLRTIPQKD
jgi:hypothetical protein